MAELVYAEVATDVMEATPIDLRGRGRGTARRQTGNQGKVDVFCWIDGERQPLRGDNGRPVELDFEQGESLTLPKEVFDARIVFLVGPPGTVVMLV